MVGLSNYEFKSLTNKIDKPEESFIIPYVYECLKSEITISSTRIMQIILDTKYEKSDINKVMKEQCQHLTTNESENILKRLKYEDLFDRTLGKWNTAPVDLELKDDTKPV